MRAFIYAIAFLWTCAQTLILRYASLNAFDFKSNDLYSCILNIVFTFKRVNRNNVHICLG